MNETATTVWFVDELQVVEPDMLTTNPEIEVVRLYIDNHGFDRVMVTGPTRESVIEYVRENWASGPGADLDWFQTWVVNRVECGEV